MYLPELTEVKSLKMGKTISDRVLRPYVKIVTDEKIKWLKKDTVTLLEGIA